MNFSGVTTALITPFDGGKIDFSSLRKLIKFQLDGGIKGFVVSGTTGEAATLSLEEKLELLKFVKAEVAEQVPVVVGSGTFNTAESCGLAQTFEKHNADGLLVVSPYYSKPPQRGLLAHYNKIAASTKLPIILYNVPSRTSSTLEPETVVKIAQQNKNIIGVKEAAGKVDVIKRLHETCASDFLIVSGDDESFVEAMTLGAHGVISVIAHVIPRLCVEAALKKKNTESLLGLAKVLFCESNPIPTKWALKKMGIIKSAETRLPLVELDEKFHQLVTQALEKAGAL